MSTITDEEFQHARGIFLRTPTRTVRDRDAALRAALEALDAFRARAPESSELELAKTLCRVFAKGYGIPLDWDLLDERTRQGYIHEALYVARYFTRVGLDGTLRKIRGALDDIRTALSVLEDAKSPPESGV